MVDTRKNTATTHKNGKCCIIGDKLHTSPSIGSDKHNKATNLITDKYYKVTNVLSNKPQNATNVRSDKRHKEIIRQIS